MKNAVLNLLCSSLIPELGSDITAGTTGNTHLGLIPVSTVGAFPYQFAVLILNDPNLSIVAADLTVITLGVQLRIHDILIDVLHNRKYRRNILLHVGNLHIRDGSTR